MKTNLVIENVGIICTLGLNPREIGDNIHKPPTLDLFSLNKHTLVPISKINKVKEDSKIPRACLLAELAIKQIVENDLQNHNSNNQIALLSGCTKGDGNTISEIFKSGNPNVRCNIDSSSNNLNEYLSKKFKIPFIPVSSAACATGAQLLCKAETVLLSGEYKSVILCMAEASLTPEMIGAFYQLGVICTDQTGTAPFQRQAKGFHMGEGAVAFKLTLKKSPTSSTIICGIGVGTDAKHFSTFPNGHQKVLEIIQETCSQIGINISNISHVNLHGTGTNVNDQMELSLAKQLKIQNPNITFSTFKQLTGHLLGASGLTEFALTLMCLQHHFLLPLHHFSEQFSHLQLGYGMNQNKNSSNTYFMTLSYGLGGTIGVIVSILPAKE